jgi:multidrug efflux pump
VTIIGLAAKNAILIVEFAIKEESEGSDAITAAKNGAQQRLRPILMTSVTFVLGMMPLVLAAGAGAASRRAVGTGVMGSMLTATLFGVFFTPLFYVAARRWLSRKKRKSDVDDQDGPPLSARSPNPSPAPDNGEPGGGRHDA